MSAEVSQIVEELAQAGSSGFRASYVARQAHTSVEEVRAELMDMVSAGKLHLKYQLICPDNGRTIRSYGREEELPLGEEVSDARCESDEPFIVEKVNIWVTFEPSAELLRGATRQLARKLKKNCLMTQRTQHHPVPQPTPWRPTSGWG